MNYFNSLVLKVLFLTVFYGYSFAQDVEVVIQQSHSVTSYAFSKDYKLLITGGRDNNVKIWDVNTALLIRTLRGHKEAVGFVGFTKDETKIVSYGGSSTNNDGSHSIITWDVETGEILNSIPCELLSFAYVVSNNYLFAGRTWSNAKVINIETGEKLFETESKFTYLDPYNEYFTTCTDQKKGHDLYSFSSEKPLLRMKKVNDQFINAAIVNDVFYCGPKYGSLSVAFDLKAQSETKKTYDLENCENKFISMNDNEFEPGSYNKPRNRGKIKIPGMGEYDLIAHNDSLILQSDSVNIKTFTGFNNTIWGVSLSPNEDMFISNSQNAHFLWSLPLCKAIQTFNGRNDGFKQGVFNPAGQSFATTCYNEIILWNTKTLKRINTVTWNGDDKKICSINISPDGKKLAVMAFDNSLPISIYNTETMEQELVLPTTERNEPDACDFSSDSKLIGYAGFGNKGDVYDFSTNTILNTFELHDITTTSVAFSPDNGKIVFGYDFPSYTSYNIKNGKEIKHYKNTSYTGFVKFAPDGNLAVGNKFGLSLRDFQSGNVVKEYKIHTDVATDIEFLNDNRFLTSSYDGTVKLYDMESNEIIATFIAIGDNEYAIVTPDYYYSASKYAYKGLNFAKGKKVFTFEQFDLKFNRPDIVAQRIGKTPENLIKAYSSAYLKRLNKMGFTEKEVNEEGLDYPELTITNENIPYQTNSKTIDITFKAFDKKHKIQRINLYINGVPVYGAKGMALTDQTQTLERSITVNLSPGINKIQLSVHNDKGVESYKETISIECLAEFKKPNLYIVSVGVSEFKQNEFDLTYAAKDARNIIDQFKKNNDFGYTYELSYLNEKATKASILNAKETLQKSKVNDMVILFVASHGLLDEDMNYYLATHDVDFSNPSVNGLPYDELEGLLDGIPARKKLMLIDACHSGEVDKDEIELADATVSNGTVTARGFKAVKQKDNQLGMQNSFELMKELFADLRRGTGAVVISSAGGAEYAFESEKWDNGVFTYALLEGLQSKNADKNKDREIRVSELRDYVIEKVQELTNGKQNPTMRRENLEFDFRVW